MRERGGACACPGGWSKLGQRMGDILHPYSNHQRIHDIELRKFCRALSIFALKVSQLFIYMVGGPHQVNEELGYS